jgi:hypothetical protein
MTVPLYRGVCCSMFLFIGLLYTGFNTVWAEEKDVSHIPDPLPSGRHRIDFDWSRIATSGGDRDVLLPGYTLAFRGDMRFGVSAALVHSDLDSTGKDGDKVSSTGYGIGDTELLYQYDPSGALTASPWVPESVGITAGLLVPTGDAQEALGGDVWVASFGFGWTNKVLSNFWLIPALGYERSFNGGEHADTTNQLEFGLDFYWIFPFGLWVGYEPLVSRDFDQNEWGNDHTFVIGWIPQRGPGLSLEYGNPDLRLEQLAGRDDRIFLLNIFYQYGRAP